MKLMSSLNVQRYFMFHTKPSLCRFMEEKGLDKRSNGTINKMIEALSENVVHSKDRVTPSAQNGQNAVRDAAIKVPLERSFLSHQKGDKHVHCSMGHFLEVPVF